MYPQKCRGWKREKKDIALVFLNDRYEIIKESGHIARPDEEHGARMIQLSNGLIAIAGFSDSKVIGKSKGLRDSWLLLYDPETNQVISDLLLGGTGNDQLVDLIESPDHFIYASAKKVFGN